MGSARSLLGLAGWLALSFLAGLVGAQYLPGEWYASLAKPALNPPNWIFAPVWTTLYVLMAVAAWLVWRRAGFAGARVPLGLYVAQLVLNGLWSCLFFGLHRPGFALFDIVILWLTILAALLLFWRTDRRAGALMLPYLLWVGFAAYLNFELWRLNSGA
jgi:tryptophan-rich sensory protein